MFALIQGQTCATGWLLQHFLFVPEVQQGKMIVWNYS